MKKQRNLEIFLFTFRLNYVFLGFAYKIVSFASSIL